MTMGKGTQVRTCMHNVCTWHNRWQMDSNHTCIIHLASDSGRRMNIKNKKINDVFFTFSCIRHIYILYPLTLLDHFEMKLANIQSRNL